MKHRDSRADLSLREKYNCGKKYISAAVSPRNLGETSGYMPKTHEF